MHGARPPRQRAKSARPLTAAAAAVFKGCGPHLLEHDALAVRRATEGVALELSAQVSLLIALLRPPLLATHGPQLARRVDSARLTCRQGQGGSAQARGRGIPSLVTTTGLMLAASGHTSWLALSACRPESAKGWRGKGSWRTAAHGGGERRESTRKGKISFLQATWKGGNERPVQQMWVG